MNDTELMTICSDLSWIHFVNGLMVGGVLAATLAVLWIVTEWWGIKKEEVKK